MKNNLLLLFIPLMLLTFSCKNTTNQVDVSDMIRTTHQLIIFKDKIIRVQRPINEWDCCSSIQLLDREGNLLSETPCNDGKYPLISIENDSIYVNYSFSPNESSNYMQPYEYYAKKYKKLGDFELFYRFKHDLMGGLSPEYNNIDSVYRDSMTVYFFYNNTKVVEKELQELLYSNNYCFYYKEIKDSVITMQYLQSNDSLLFINYFHAFFKN